MTVVATTIAEPPVLNSQVLVLNKHYMAVRIISIKRAISLLFRDLAEVIDYDEGQYSNYNFENWLEVSELKQRFEPNAHDWLHTVKLSIAVPRIVRLPLRMQAACRNGCLATNAATR